MTLLSLLLGTSALIIAARAAEPTPAPTAATARALTQQARLVTPGEQVQVAPGLQVWLQQDGAHWSRLPRSHPSRGNPCPAADRDSHHDTVQGESTGDGNCALWGMYRGASDPAKVIVDTPQGPVTGMVVRLAGTSGWALWYAITHPPQQARSRSAKPGSRTQDVTIYDATDQVIARETIPN